MIKTGREVIFHRTFIHSMSYRFKAGWRYLSHKVLKPPFSYSQHTLFLNDAFSPLSPFPGLHPSFSPRDKNCQRTKELFSLEIT